MTTWNKVVFTIQISVIQKKELPYFEQLSFYII